MIKGIVYKYTSPSNKCYIGQTTRESKRKLEHIRVTSNIKSKFGKAITKYGIKSFKYEILVCINSNDTRKLKIILDTLERYYIKKYNSFKSGYNMTLGGESKLGYKTPTTVRTKISNSLKGHTDSLNTKMKKSKSHLGKKLSQSSIEKCKLAFRNRSIESETNRINKSIAVTKGKPRCKRAVYITALKNRRSVIQMLDNNTIKVWDSIKEAAIELELNPSNIVACCKGKSRTTGGYKWKYKEEYNG